MKNFLTSLLMLLLFSVPLLAQNGLNTNQKALRISLLLPSAHAEFHLGSNITVEGFTTLDYLRGGINGLGVSVAGGVGLHYYYNAHKRIQNNRTTHLFSGNAISLQHSLTLLNTDRYTLASGREITYRTSSYTIAHLFRRPIGKMGFWDIGLGGGILYRPDFSSLELVPNLRLGVGIGF